MSDQYIEKAFLYVLLLSLLAHIAIFAFVILFPEKKPVAREKPVMVELEDMPRLKSPVVKTEKDLRRHDVRRHRVSRETAPKGEMRRERIAPPRTRGTPSPARPQQHVVDRRARNETGKRVEINVPSGKDLLKPKKNLPDLAQLFPDAGKMERLEESYRKKYGPEVEDGETKFLNTDDILFGSFLRRFETAVYGLWKYPVDAARMGIEGVTAVKITFNRKGEIMGDGVQLLESSGSRILDGEVFRTLAKLGPVGSFPKGFDKDKFYLIAFFQYGIIRGTSKGMLR